MPAKSGDARDLDSIPGSGRSPGGGHGNPLQYSCLENPHGQRSLAGYSPWGSKVLDTTEWLGTHSSEVNSNLGSFFIDPPEQTKEGVFPSSFRDKL